MKISTTAFARAILVLVVPASAGVVTSLPGGTVVAMPEVSDFGSGPQTFGGITWTSDAPSSVFGYAARYSFIGNGELTGALGPMAGLNSFSGTMTFTLSAPVSGIGGF